MNQTHIVRAAYAELRRVAEREGPEGAALLDMSEFCLDTHTGHAVLSLWFARDKVWEQRLPISKGQLDGGAISIEEAEKCVLQVMRDTLSLVGQKEHTRLNARFPKSIVRVEVEYMMATRERNFTVFFKNGHIAEGTESEIHTDHFLARCAMIYDLPPL